MLRVWPAQGAQRSAESTSFLKVDPRKKQVTLYDPAAGPPGNTGPRRAATTAVPKMFAFDAVFPQDSEQVRVWVSCGLGQGSSGPRGQTSASSVPVRGKEPGGPRGAAQGRPVAFPFLLTPQPSGVSTGIWPGSQAKFPFPGEEPARLGSFMTSPVSDPGCSELWGCSLCVLCMLGPCGYRGLGPSCVHKAA